jgi:hypothetical protein
MRSLCAGGDALDPPLVKDAHKEVVLDRTPSPYDEKSSSSSSLSSGSLEEELQSSGVEGPHFQAFHSIKALDKREVLFNWSRTNPLGALDQVWRPETRIELQALLRGDLYRKLRLIGAGLSFEPIHSVYAEGSQALLVDLQHLRGQLDTTADTVVYQAGTPLDTIYADLIAMERMLPASPGVIGIQTLGGSLSTGTHGQGLHQSTLCDAVDAMTVMLANGDIIRVDRSDPRFGAFVMGMGMLGILLDVTLRTVPNRVLRCTKATTDYPYLLEHNERLNREHEFVKSWWFAWTGQSHIWSVDPCECEFTC